MAKDKLKIVVEWLSRRKEDTSDIIEKAKGQPAVSKDAWVV